MNIAARLVIEVSGTAAYLVSVTAMRGAGPARRLREAEYREAA
jgi:hypothetical protein